MLPGVTRRYEEDRHRREAEVRLVVWISIRAFLLYEQVEVLRVVEWIVRSVAEANVESYGPVLHHVRGIQTQVVAGQTPLKDEHIEPLFHAWEVYCKAPV